MNNKQTIDRILRDAWHPELPYGFAERVARAAMTPHSEQGIWDYLLQLTPRTSVALGAIATLLIVFGFTGSGPELLDSVNHYALLSNPFPLP
jgi:hypothetical protein